MEFEFIADRPVLDFLPTLAERGHADVEQLSTPTDFASTAYLSGMAKLSTGPTRNTGEAPGRSARRPA
ncbi:hypothetical protein ABZ749_24395, partial [Micromonospora sp. NPDC047753]|uniref:hypothetical protein n=1 Tax=Micromonospora sp. NPDC047753 TaxID=3154817 RepID=UPI003408645C